MCQTISASESMSKKKAKMQANPPDISVELTGVLNLGWIVAMNGNKRPSLAIFM